MNTLKMESYYTNEMFKKYEVFVWMQNIQKKHDIYINLTIPRFRS